MANETYTRLLKLNWTISWYSYISVM